MVGPDPGWTQVSRTHERYFKSQVPGRTESRRNGHRAFNAVGFSGERRAARRLDGISFRSAAAPTLSSTRSLPGVKNPDMSRAWPWSVLPAHGWSHSGLGLEH